MIRIDRLSNAFSRPRLLVAPAATRGLPTALAASVLLGVAAVLGSVGRAEAQTVVFSIPGTGQNKTTSGGITTDDNWQLVAMPSYVCTGSCSSFSVLNPTPAAPTPVYISNSVPGPWINDASGSPTEANGITIDGVTYNWITYATYPNNFGATGTDNSQSFFNRLGSQLSIATVQNGVAFSGNYSYIMAAEFVATAGTYNLNFDASADNRIQLYLVPGALSGVQISRASGDGFTPQQPGILGATLLAQNAANTAGQFGTIWTEANSSNVQSQVTFTAGTYTLLYRVTDNWSVTTQSPNGTFGSTGAFVGSTFFTDPTPPSAVPGPLPILGAGAAFATSRKLRRRIQLTRSGSAPSPR